ncbi:hypothetical protein [Adlercreutzia sp. ZJ138]|uniref:hypothetical protein n=1 Tax=Adlercreutzia sp. ZJ138 TaxID=2709405 RepID=UPI0013EA5B9B|nr:hypothetical protein [Adlercreutzia sp. ZJ138]
MQATTQSPDTKLVRGFSIANIILSSLAIAAFVAGALFTGLGGIVLSDPNVYSEFTEELATDPDIAHGMDELHAEGYSFDENDLAGLVGLGIDIFVIFLVIGALLCVVSLVAGILGLKNYDKSEKLGAAFGWSIAGAVCSILCGRIVSTVLLVLEAVYIHKVQQAANAPSYNYAQAQAGAAQPGQYYGQQPAYGQHVAPGYAAPGYAAPTAPTAPAGYPAVAEQPTIPATPAQPVAPATPAAQPKAPAEPAATTPAAPEQPAAHKEDDSDTTK